MPISISCLIRIPLVGFPSLDYPHNLNRFRRSEHIPPPSVIPRHFAYQAKHLQVAFRRLSRRQQQYHESNLALGFLEVDGSYVTRILKLTTLAPDIVEAIINGEEPDSLSLAKLTRAFPEEWGEQRRSFGANDRCERDA